MKERLKRIIFRAFMGSVAHNAGLGVILVYIATIGSIVLESIFVLLGKGRAFLPVPIGVVSLSTIFLVMGYFCNPPNEQGKWMC